MSVTTFQLDLNLPYQKTDKRYQPNVSELSVYPAPITDVRGNDFVLDHVTVKTILKLKDFKNKTIYKVAYQINSS